jgi:hypothetical protein
MTAHFTCRHRVFSPERWDVGGHDCSYRARFDPDAKGIPTACKVHSQAAQEERGRKSRERYDRAMAERLAPGKRKRKALSILDALVRELDDTAYVDIVDIARQIRAATSILRGETECP